MRLRHICEVCGREETLTPGEAFDAGWDYPPWIGSFGTLSPRTCPDCPLLSTVWAAVALNGHTVDMLTDAQHAVIARIAGEPESILVTDGD